LKNIHDLRLGEDLNERASSGVLKSTANWRLFGRGVD